MRTSIRKLISNASYQQVRKEENMPGSLRCKLSKLRHKGQITAEEYEELIKKLDGHDKEIRNKAIDEFAEKCKERCMRTQFCMIKDFEIDEIAERMKGGAE